MMERRRVPNLNHGTGRLYRKKPTMMIARGTEDRRRPGNGRQRRTGAGNALLIPMRSWAQFVSTRLPTPKGPTDDLALRATTATGRNHRLGRGSDHASTPTRALHTCALNAATTNSAKGSSLNRKICWVGPNRRRTGRGCSAAGVLTAGEERALAGTVRR